MWSILHTKIQVKVSKKKRQRFNSTSDKTSVAFALIDSGRFISWTCSQTNKLPPQALKKNLSWFVLRGIQQTRLRSADPRCPPASLTWRVWAASEQRCSWSTIRPNVSSLVVPKNCADSETCELMDTSCVGANSDETLLFIFSLGEQDERAGARRW